MRKVHFVAITALAVSVVSGWGGPGRAADTSTTTGAPAAGTTTTGPAATTPDTTTPRRHRAPRQPRMPKYFGQLNLTADEQTKIDAALADEAAQLKTLNDDTTMQPADKKAKRKAIRDASNAQLLTFLTTDQQTQLTGLQSKNNITRLSTNFQKRFASLDLTADQQAKLQKIADDYATQQEAINGDKTLSTADRRTKGRDLQKAIMPQVLDLLTADQKTKWQASRKTNRGGRGNQTPVTTPPAAATNTAVPLPASP